MKKTIFILTYLFLSILILNSKPSESTLLVSKEELIQSEYSQNYYLLTFESINSNELFTHLNDSEIYIISITPRPYKSINETIYAKGTNAKEIHTNLIKDFTNLLKEKLYIEEAIYIEQKGINIKNIKLLTMQKKIDELKTKIDFEYTLEN